MTLHTSTVTPPLLPAIPRSEPASEWDRRARDLAVQPWVDFRRDLEGYDSDQRRAALRLRLRYRLDEFAKLCFPDICYRDLNPVHQDIVDRPKTHWRDRISAGVANQQRLIAAPRGTAKTTFTRVDLVHDLVYGLEGYLVVLAATRDDAKAWTRFMRQSLLKPDTFLSWLYGPFEMSGGEWESYITVPGFEPVPLFTRSFNKGSVRGMNEFGVRPTRVVFDDAEDRRYLDNIRIRDDWQTFLNDDVLHLGAMEGGAIYDWLCTVQHVDAISQRIVNRDRRNGGWRSTVYRAFEGWPHAVGLWEQCKALYTDLRHDKETRERMAFLFYKARQEEMTAGITSVLDEAALSVFKVFTAIWNKGKASVLRELFNQPRDPSSTLFDSTTFKQCRAFRDAAGDWQIENAFGWTVPLQECRRRLRWDVSGGVSKDYACISAMARDIHGYTYVLETWLDNTVKPSGQRQMMWALAERWGITQGTMEGNGFQDLAADESFRREKEERKAEGRFHTLQIEVVNSTLNKGKRIASMEPDVLNGHLQFNGDLGLNPVAAKQYDNFSRENSDKNRGHDDVPDVHEAGKADLKNSGTNAAWVSTPLMEPAPPEHPFQ